MIIELRTPQWAAVGDLVTGTWVGDEREPQLSVAVSCWPLHLRSFSPALQLPDSPVSTVDRGNGPLIPIGCRPSGTRLLPDLADVRVEVILLGHPYGQGQLALRIGSLSGHVTAVLEQVEDGPVTVDAPHLTITMDWWRAVQWLGDGHTLFADLAQSQIEISGHLGCLSWLEGVRFAAGLVEPEWRSGDLIEFARLWSHGARRLSSTLPTEYSQRLANKATPTAFPTAAHDIPAGQIGHQPRS